MTLHRTIIQEKERERESEVLKLGNEVWQGPRMDTAQASWRLEE